ncbi:MAG: MarR family transcriptional regulator [Spirochaetia bacterium]|jgi:DNA-binding MarR family transcriptional regulator
MIDAEVSIREFRKNLRVLEREVELSMTSEAGCCGVTFAQCHLLLEIERRERTSITELASILDLDKSTLSRTVDAASRAGLLDRSVDPASRRQQVISLTARGRETTETINSQCDASYTRLFDFIPREERSTVVRAVALLADAMRQKRRHPESACCVDDSHV